MFKLHFVMLTAFVGPKPAGKEVCHYPDPDRSNCSLGNLRWGTRIENANDRRLHGTHPAGIKNPRAKLTDSQVFEIRRLFAAQANPKDKRTLAARFGVTPTTIRYIVEGATWRHLTPIGGDR